MNCLLDTHALIWYFDNSSKLSQKMRQVLTDPSNKLFISSASLWEIVIKIGLGKLNLSFDNILTKLTIGEIEVLQVEASFMAKTLELPYIHKDPFDRLIIATALVADMTILTTDENIRKYDVTWMW